MFPAAVGWISSASSTFIYSLGNLAPSDHLKLLRMDPGIFWAALEAVGATATLAMAGVLLHRNGMVTPESKTVLSRFSEQIALPALLFSTFVKCSPGGPCPRILDRIHHAEILLLWPFYVTGMGLLVAHIAIWIAAVPPTHQRFVYLATAFANSSSLPLTLLSVIEANRRRNSADSTSPSISAGADEVDPTLLLSIYLMLYPVLQWGIGGWLISHDQQHGSATNSQSTTSVAVTTPVTRQKEPLALPSYVPHGDEEGGLIKMGERSHTPETANESDDSINDESLERLLDHSVVPTADHVAVASPTESFWTHNIRSLVANALRPPVLGALSGLAVALCPPIHGLLVNLQTGRDDVLLGWFFSSVRTIGQAAVPVSMATLGVNLSMAAQQTRQCVRPSTIAGVVIGKLMVMPIVGVLSCLLHRYLFQVPANMRSSFYLVLMIVFITPTANNVMVMVDISKSHVAEHSMAKIIAWQYLFSPILLSLSVMCVVRIASMS